MATKKLNDDIKFVSLFDYNSLYNCTHNNNKGLCCIPFIFKNITVDINMIKKGLEGACEGRGNHYALEIILHRKPTNINISLDFTMYLIRKYRRNIECRKILIDNNPKIDLNLL